MRLIPAKRQPKDVMELRAMIASKAVTLPTQMEQVVRGALAKPDLVAFGTASSIANACAVSPSTVVRVAVALGFSSFRELRAIFREHLKEIHSKGTSSGAKDCQCHGGFKPTSPHPAFEV